MLTGPMILLRGSLIRHESFVAVGAVRRLMAKVWGALTTLDELKTPVGW